MRNTMQDSTFDWLLCKHSRSRLKLVVEHVLLLHTVKHQVPCSYIAAT